MHNVIISANYFRVLKRKCQVPNLPGVSGKFPTAAPGPLRGPVAAQICVPTAYAHGQEYPISSEPV